MLIPVPTKSSLSLDDGTYFVSVRSTDNSGNVSEVVSSDGVIVDITAPSAPTNLSSIAGDMIVSLSWKANIESDLKEYLIYRSGARGFTPSDANRVAEVGPAITSYTDSNMEYGNTYYYKISALDHVGFQSAFSNEVSSTPFDYTAPMVNFVLPESNSAFELGTNLDIEWLAEDNSATVLLDLDYTVDNGLNWLEVTKDEENDGLFSWLVPNTPSEEVGVRLIARDLAGLSDTSEVAGLSIYIVYPEVVEMYP